MKIILTMAISANGIIATKDGSEDFLSYGNWKQFVKLVHKIGCLVWGRKTYEAVLGWRGNSLNELKDFPKVILSKSSIKLKKGFILVHSPEEAIEKLRLMGFKEIIVTGGGSNNSEFAKRGLIDEVILDVNPSIVGNGISLFKKDDFFMKLKLTGVEKVNKNIVELKYKVIK